MFLYHSWLRLPISTRHTLAQQFGIQKKGPTEVSNNEVIKDGYPIGDIERALNVDAIQKYVGSEETDLTVLWEELVAKAEGRTLAVKESIIIPQEVPTVEVPKKRGRPTKVK